MERQIYINGKFVPESQAKISIYDSSLIFGDMAYEITRSFKKKQFLLREHLTRLINSIKYLDINLEFSVVMLEKAVNETVSVNESLFEDDEEHQIMINVTRGLHPMYEKVQGIEKGTQLIIADFPLSWTTASLAPYYDSGINVVIPSQRAIPASLLDPKVKSRSRVHYQLANIEVSKYKGDNNWALLTDPDGFITEGTGSNFFIVKGDVIYTPEPRNILRGMSRDYVIRSLVPAVHLICVEKNIGLYDVITADEAFTTSTPFCIMPVTSINKIPIGEGKVGPITIKLLQCWSKNVDVDIVKQVRGYYEKSKQN